MEKIGRQKNFRRNAKLETFLVEMNHLLRVAENKVIQRYSFPEFPVVFIVGCARSGTTFMLQWLANTGFFSYPTNLLSRFYEAPYIGAMIQRLLTDKALNFRDEFEDLALKIDYESELGKTRGLLAPNEFWYFWRRFFPTIESNPDVDVSQLNVEWQLFNSELAAVESVLNKPLAMKAMIINSLISLVSREMKKVLFVNLVREPFFTAQSILESRNKFFGTHETWYSFKPIEYQKLKDLNPYQQVAGQIYFTRKNIEMGLAKIEPSQHLTISYENFCEFPSNVFSKIKQKFYEQGTPLDLEYLGPSSFECNNVKRCGKEVEKKIMDAYQDIVQSGGIQC